MSTLVKECRKPFTKYVLSEHSCPKCGQKGSLFVTYIPRARGGWNGGYFAVKHTTWKHDAERYAKVKIELGKCPCCGQSLVRGKSIKTYKDSWRTCYFGKQYPKPISVTIPSPE